MKQNKVLLFDLDGTLIDTNSLIMDTFITVFRSNFPEISLSRELLLSFIGPTLKETFSRYTEDDDMINKLITEYRKINLELHDDYVILYPFVKKTLKKLKRKGFHMAIVTSKKKDVAERGLKITKINKFFDLIIGCDEVKKHKPDPESINLALSHYPYTKESYMIGDNTSDILAGKNAGINTIGVKWSLKINDLLISDPDYMLNDFKEILEILGVKKC